MPGVLNYPFFIMPRKARIGAPGAVQHIIVRGIERKDIFRETSIKTPLSSGLEKLSPTHPHPATRGY